MPMNPEIKARWVAALRSGEYKQASGYLRVEGDAFCCLGVLCNLHAQVHPEVAAKQVDPHKYMGMDNYPHEEVMRWAGIYGECPEVVIAGESAPLYTHNDGFKGAPKSFAQIADAIESQL